jgi:hypothetical protein
MGGYNMTDKLKYLMAGTDDFREIIQGRGIYVDKTNFLAKLILTKAKVWFLSRPRRFGKSLTVSTLQTLFSGNRELFKGLAIESNLDDELFAPRPVIRLDMSRIDTSEGLSIFKKSLINLLNQIAKELDVTVDPNSYSSDILQQIIIQSAMNSGQRVAILIDEYDAPFVAYMDSPDLDNLRKSMRVFYNTLKSMNTYISFIFVTGITKAAHMGLLSVFNTYTDISSNPDYGAMLGFTQEELEYYFADHIELTADSLKMTKNDLLEKMKAYYNGFCFDGVTRLYNPFSTMQFFIRSDFGLYWFKTGTPSILTKIMRNNQLNVEDIRGTIVTKDFADDPGEYQESDPESFLYQSGYLSLRPGPNENSYTLEYPNREVLEAMSRLLVSSYLGRKSFGDIFIKLQASLADRNASDLINEFNKFLANVPYDYYNKATYKQELTSTNKSKIDYIEFFYHSLLFTLLYATSIEVLAESHGSIGRRDIVICHKGIIWVIVLKVKKEEGEKEGKLLENAIEQINENRYAKAYDNPVCLAIVIDNNNRSISSWKSF